jgi:hypothetical protein
MKRILITIALYYAQLMFAQAQVPAMAPAASDSSAYADRN